MAFSSSSSSPVTRKAAPPKSLWVRVGVGVGVRDRVKVQDRVRVRFRVRARVRVRVRVGRATEELAGQGRG